MADETTNSAELPEDSAVTITDADALQAMASPIRMRILGVLRVKGAQTVGMIGGQLGEAPGAISYHLGQLSRAGLAEKVESPDKDRRKSWWRACQSAIRLGDTKNDDEAGSKAADMFRRSAALSYEMAYERFLDRMPELPKEWTDACTSDDHVLRMTPEEMRAMVDDLNEVIRRWQLRTEQHDEDEREAETVAVTLQAFRWMP